MLDPLFETARAKILELNGRYISGKEDAFDATRDLLNYLLTLTVVQTGQSLRFMRNVEAHRQSRVIGEIQRGPLALNDGRYLRIWVSLKLEYDEAFGRHKLRVYNASYQYQEDPASDEWIIRYDYTRLPPDHILAESESAFNEIAHKPLSGPPHELTQKSKL